MGENSTVNVSESPPRGAEARGSTEKRFTLRYSRVCRDCRRPLAAGTRAVHDSTTRSVRCIACPEPGTAATLEKTPPIADSTSAPGGIPRLPPAPLTHRAPASGVIAEALRLQANASSRSRLDRLFGRSPLAPDAESWFLGAIGEIEVARILAALGSEWRVFHSVPVGSNGSDIDHLVIGPAGRVHDQHKTSRRQVGVGRRPTPHGGWAADRLPAKLRPRGGTRCPPPLVRNGIRDRCGSATRHRRREADHRKVEARAGGCPQRRTYDAMAARPPGDAVGRFDTRRGDGCR